MKKIIWIAFVVHGMISAAVDGSLDNTFGNGGQVTTVFTGSTLSTITEVIVQPDTKIVAIGAATISGSSDFAVVRYNSDGSLDISFGTNGMVSTSFGGSDTANAGLLQPNGKIVAAGTTDVATNFALARYNADGSLDPSFGTNGLVTTNVGGNDSINAVLLQPDGKIVAVGFSGDNFALARYNVNGLLDLSFGTNGIVTTNFGGSDLAAAAALQPDGKIIAVGQTDTGGTVDFALARYNTNGSLDTSFGTNGIVLTNFGGEDIPTAVALQPDGKIVVAGATDKNGTFDFAVARYNSNGSLDTSFGTNGIAITNIGGIDIATAVVILSDGKIVAGGRSSVNGNDDFALVRYDTNGTLDTSFGTNGIVTTGFGANDTINSMFIQSDGKIVAAGSATISALRFALARYLIPSITISTLARDIRAKYFLFQ